MNTNNSIFTRVLALMICFIMLVGGLTACFQETDPENNVSTTTTNGGVTTLPTTQPTITTPTTTQPTTGTTTGDVVGNDPVEDPVDPNVIFSASTTIDASNLILGTLVNDVVIGGEGSTALVPADVMVETNASSLALTLKNVEENDVDLGDVELLNNLDVHISGIAANNTVPMTVALGAILEAGLGATELKLYHIENGTPVLMTRVTSANDFSIHNQYTYNAETGEVTIYVASFSVFAAVRTEADKWDGTSVTTWYNENDTKFTLTTAEQFAGFRDLVDGGNTFEGKTVILGTDIDLEFYKEVEVVENEVTVVKEERVSFDPIGKGYVHLGGQAFMGTFDGGNHTIYGVYQNGWELGYDYGTQGGGLFASVQNATIKNLVVSNADIVMECIDMGIVVGYAQGICYFENIIVTNSTIANYNRATGGVVGEVCFGPYGTDITKGYSHTFKNITVDSSVVVSSLWGSFDTLCGGVIGGKWGDASVLMDNVKVAAELDVYSDVTAAYQWYAYRRCGMLIGYTEQESPKKADHAHADFLTCNNVDVYYGDWVNYNYYRFDNQDSDTGRRYPWVRAEASPVGNNGAFSNPRYGVPTHNGVKVTELDSAALNGVATDYTPIIFNQLYGGGQGVYGTNEHAENRGVTIHNSLKKTILVTSNCTNLKLYYWFANGDDTWTTLIEGIDMSTMLVEGNTYKIELPAYAYGFKIIADEAETEELVLGTLEDNAIVTLDKPCAHEYDNACDATCNLCEAERVVTHTPGAEADCENAQTCTVCGAELVKALGHTEVVDEAVAATCTTAGKTEGKHCSVCNEVLVAQKTVAALGHDWNHSTHICNRCDKKAETKTIYFLNNWSWKTPSVYMYYTGATGTVDFGAFPGTAMTKETTDGVFNVYKVIIPDYVTAIVFNDGTKAETEGHQQSIDLTYAKAQDGYIYSMLWDNDDTNNKDNLASAKYVTGYKTIYFLNNWNWETPQYSYMGASLNMKYVKQEGTYKTYSFTLPNFVTEFKVFGGSDESENITSVTNGATYCMYYTNNKKQFVECIKLYLKPNSNWTSSNAWFAARIWNSSGDAWFKMNKDGDYYSCYVPQGYVDVIFCRMNSANTSKYEWGNVWNQTSDLKFSATSNCYTIASGAWSNGSGTWTKK